MKCYVISVASAEERRRHMAAEFQRHGLGFDFFDAVTPDTVAATSARLGLRLEHCTLKPSEVGCLLSHVALWQQVVDRDLPYAAIFEDDIHLGRDAGRLLADTAWWPQDADIVKLERFYTRVLVQATAVPLPGGRRLAVLREKHMGAGGYIVSRASAAALLALARSYDALIPVDHIIFNDYLVQRQARIYQMLPALCIQDHILKGKAGTLPSQLSAERRVRKGWNDKKPLGLAGKARREIKRVQNQLQLAVRTQTVKLAGQRLVKNGF